LTELGATRIVDRVDCEPDYEAAASRWLSRVVEALTRAPAPLGQDGAAPASHMAAPPRRPASPSKTQGYTKKNPLITGIVRNVTLSHPKSAKDVRQLVFQVPDDTVSYAVGDA